ncbi:MAG TPA: twin-arginine translocase TatA/TatE family subunit [Fimbriimonadaceae bacterium]|jgi:sec-independent protein translocase protein TatA
MYPIIASFGPEPLLIVFVVILILFGGKKIPELLRGVGRGVGELQKGLAEGKQHFESALHNESETPATVTTTPIESQPRTTPTSTPSESGGNI